MVSEPQPQRTRIPVTDPRPQPDPARTGCLWAGGVLGVIAGIVVTFLAVPSILNFLFPSKTIELGETFENDKLELRIVDVLRDEIEKEPASDAAYVVRIQVEAQSSWSPRFDNFVLVLSDETEIRSQPRLRRAPLERQPTSAEVPQGSSLLELSFSNGEPSLAEPDSLHLEEPAVKFKLPIPVAP